jgi:uncharacterized delta-60 repeat protein
MMFERLEARRLLTLSVSGTVVNITGTGGNDAIELYQQSGVLYYQNSATGVSSTFSGTFTAVNVTAGGGNDYVRLRRADGTRAVSVPATLSGGLGNDTLIGGEGNDNLIGSDGDDTLDGRGGADILSGGAGFDTADYSSRSDALRITVDASSGANDGAVGEGDNVLTEAVLGGSGADQIFGDAAGNFINGNGGNDTLVGGFGNDTLVGGTGADVIFGQDGNDFLSARETFADQISDGPGTDSASVDNTAAGDPVNDTATNATPPNPPASAFASRLAGRGLRDVAEDDGGFGDLNRYLDNTFDGDGLRTLGLGGDLAEIRGVALQTIDYGEAIVEQIIVVGTAIGPGGDYDAFVARLNGDGSLDGSFGDGAGVVYTDFSDSLAPDDDAATGVIVDQLGRIVITGFITERRDGTAAFENAGDYVIARYLPDGQLDRTFSGDGLARLAAGPAGSDDRAVAIAFQRAAPLQGEPEDFYLVTGTVGGFWSSSFEVADFGTARWRLDGTLDEDFGVRRTDFGRGAPGSTYDYATSLAVEPGTGNYWVGGYTLGVAEDGADFAVTYGIGAVGPIQGLINTFDLGGDDYANGVAATPGGGAILVGRSGERGAILKLANVISPAGTAFVGDGQQFVSLNAVTLDASGLAVAAGQVVAGDESNFLVYRFDTATLDGDGYLAVTDFGGDDLANAVAIQDDGKILAAGRSDASPALARLLPGGESEPIAEVVLEPGEFETFVFEDLPPALVNNIRPLSISGVLNIAGTQTDDEIIVDFDPQTGLLSVSVNGSIQELPIRDITGLFIEALGGNDSVKIDPELTLPVTILGGEGNDSLCGGGGDDSIDGQGGDDLAWGLGGDDELIGGAGSDGLVGGLGNDVLRGGTGRDLLIGGADSDQLSGGEDDDLLIGGTTSFDSSGVSQLAILAEWNSSRSYAQRLANLAGPGSGNGANGNVYLRAGTSTAKTVFDDGRTDDIAGDGGADVFYANVSPRGVNDLLRDLERGERLMKL